MNNKDKIYIFAHVPKCAGSTFSFHIKKNFSESEGLEPSLDDIGLDSKTTKRYEYKYNDYIKGVENYITKLGNERKEKIKVIYGHITPYGIHKFFDKEPFYFTFLRDPMKRTASLYNYWRTRFDDEPKKNKTKLYFTRNLLKNGSVLEFGQWLEERYDNKSKRSGSNSINHYLNKMGYLNGNSSITETALDKFDFVGLNSNFNSDSLFVYEKLGISKFFLSRNISRDYVSEKEITANKISMDAKNKIDTELFKVAQKKNLTFRKSNRYSDTVRETRIKRNLFLPFTQVLYDFSGIRHALPGLMREKLRLS